jgi:hypothetical protein
MVTSRTPKLRAEHAAKWFRDGIRAHLVSDGQAGTNAYWPRAIGVGLVLVALIGLTTLAVAWVSVWGMLIYLALMVLIFVTPHEHKRPKWLSKPSKESTGRVLTDFDRNLRLDLTDESDHLHLATEFISSSMVSESNTEAVFLHPDSTSSGTVKARRSRGRVRRAVKTTSESGPSGFVSVTWIRVGPGNFVRADVQIQTVDQSQIEEVIVEAHLPTDAPVEVLLAPLALVKALVEDSLPDLLDGTPGEEGKVAVCDDRTVGSAVEVYGIAPSAFSLIPPDSFSVEGLEHNLSDMGVTPVRDSSASANLDRNTSWDEEDRGQLGLQWGPSESRVCRALRGHANTRSNANRAYLRRNVRNGPKLRTLVWSSDPLNVRLRQAAHRTFGRLSHVQRALRPRSPPAR